MWRIFENGWDDKEQIRTRVRGMDQVCDEVKCWTPQGEMQLARAWHAIIAFGFIATVIAHIYIGSIGMAGAIDASGSGEVDVQWAREHHGLWCVEVTGGPATGRARPRRKGMMLR